MRRATAALVLALAVASPALAQPTGSTPPRPIPAPAVDLDAAPRASDVLALANATRAPADAARIADALRGAPTERALRAATTLLDGPPGATAATTDDVVLALGGGAGARSPALLHALALADLRAAAGPGAAATVRAAGELLASLDASDPARAASLERELDRAAAKVDPAAALEASIARVLAAGRARLSPAEAARLADAVALGEAAHAGMARDGGEPALLHSLRVARAALARPGVVDAATVQAAVLHDVVEDTKVPLSEVRARLGERVATLVHALTLDPVEAFGGDKAARDRAYYERLAREVPLEAHLVKLLDRRDNLNDMRGWPLEGRLGYLRRTRETVLDALGPRSPALAAELEAELGALEARLLRARERGALERPAAPLERWRRADGTLRWKDALADRATVEAAGLLHLGLALFLKELAVVVRTGDSSRVDEFLDGLLSTDFYVTYGLFALGARAGEVAYAKSLERLVRPRFVSGLLKANVSLAVGLALPDLVRGTFRADAFAISLGALGLSSTAVRAGMAAISWVREVREVEGAVAVGRAGAVLGWTYTVVETAVVLYLADAIESRVTAWRDERAARAALVTAEQAFFAEAGRDGADLDAATARFEDAWAAWRAWSLGPLALEEARLERTLAALARRAEVLHDEGLAAAAALRSQPALRRSMLSRYGTEDAWLVARGAKDEAALAADADAALAAYARARAAIVRRVTDEGLRGAPRLAGTDALSWHASGAVEAGANDPWGARHDIVARWGRARARGTFAAALGRASTNRGESFADEREALALARAAARPGVRPALEAALARLDRAADLDRRLTEAASRGLVDALGAVRSSAVRPGAVRPGAVRPGDGR